jgi:hypothetical protein
MTVIWQVIVMIIEPLTGELLARVHEIAGKASTRQKLTASIETSRQVGSSRNLKQEFMFLL